MAYSSLYAPILLLLLASSSSSSSTHPPPPPPPLATACVVIEDFPDGHFNVYSNECRGKSPYCLFSCIQHQQYLLPSLSNVDRFNCSDLDYCSLSCLGAGDPAIAAADPTWADLAIDVPDREVFDWDLGGGEVESAEAAKCDADLHDTNIVEGESIPAMAQDDEM